jgi:class 3 adenylate cyclase
VDGADVAYQVVGDGPFDLIYCVGLGSNVDLMWDVRPHREFFTSVASFCRLILFDRRGTGLSDPIPNDAFPPWEDWAEDIRAVLDAAGSERPAIVGEAEGGAMAVLFTVTNPHRVRALGLLNTTARYLADDDYPIGFDRGLLDLGVEFLRTSWGSEAFWEFMFGPVGGHTDYMDTYLRQMRGSTTPRSTSLQWRHIIETVDVRHVLGLVRAPTVVMHHRDDPITPFSHAQYLAAHIPGAKLVEWPGTSDLEMVGQVAEELAVFLTGEPHGFEVDRMLTTMLFTDIVGSTELAASLGDREWRSLLDAHDRTVRNYLRRYRGNEVKTTGDGFLACFDGPARAIRCAQAIADATRALGIELHVGLHTGECEVRGDDLFGLAVHIAARIASLSTPSEVLVSGTVKDLVVGSRIEFIDRGEHKLRGVPGIWRLFSAGI